MIRSPILLALLLLAGSGAHGQALKDTLHLREVEVTAPRLAQFASGTKVLAMDSATLARYRAKNLADLLADQSPIFIKSYGAGSLATSSFRGGSANHTAVLWNGFNIGSPMNGLIDLSLIPVSFMNSVSVQYGGGSALWGSGAVAGTIQLNNAARFDQGLVVEAGGTFGSFGDRRQHVHLEYGKGRWITTISAFHAAANNDFVYRNAQVFDAPERTQHNAELEQSGALLENHFRINARQRVNLRFWYQNSDRHIPPTTLQPVSTARQQDESYRVTAEWQRSGARVNTYLRAAYFDERLRWHAFRDDPAAPSRSRNVIAEAEMRIKLSENQSIDAGINNTFAQAVSEGFPQRAQQNRVAFFAAYRLNSADHRSRTTLSFRQEMIQQVAVPFTFSLGSEYALNKVFTIKGQGAKVYRVPTFNDLYWVPGGNPALLPESGYCGELGLAAKWAPRTHLSLSGEVTAFERTMDNWIIWLPGPAYWTPRNVMNVWSRGMETRAEVGLRLGQVDVTLAAMSNYVLSTNERAVSANDASVDKQLIYVPMYSGNGTISARYKRIGATYGASYVGYRYTSTDGLQFLDPYTLVNASVSYAISPGTTYGVDLLAQCFNLFDERYEVMRSRPMPLRNYQVGLSVHFNKPPRSAATAP